MTKAIYAASFDPITNGHLNIIERASKIYDEVVVVVADNPDKKYLFSVDERSDMVYAALSKTGIKNFSVFELTNQYVTKFAKDFGCKIIVRGLRNVKDLEDEMILASENRQINPETETVFIPCLPEFAHVSSSLVRGHIGIASGWEEQVKRLVPPNVYEMILKKDIYNDAKKHWNFSMKYVNVNVAKSEKVFKKIVDKYTEPHRAYHNLEHIVEMFELYMEYLKETKSEFDIKLAFAIWFHDIVYDPKAKDNEDKSHTFGGDLLVDLDFGSLPSLSEIEKLILATKHNALPVTLSEKLIVDLDLSILGKNKKRFERYEESIRREYFFVSDTDFNVGRMQILKSFLERRQIFNLHFFERFEGQAKKNLIWSIGELSKGVKS